MAANAPTSALGFLAAMLGLAGGAWWWRSQVVGTQRIAMPAERWEQVREQYPMPTAVSDAPSVGTEVLQGFVEANPFSPLRRYVTPPPDEPLQAGQAPVAPPQPVLRFKGRILLGQKQRAVLEDLTAKKTYFLEVGQEVAGYKVLDIAENRVLLSDPQKNEEVALFLAPEGSKSQGDGSASRP